MNEKKYKKIRKNTQKTFFILYVKIETQKRDIEQIKKTKISKSKEKNLF